MVAVQRPNGQYHAESAPVVAWASTEMPGFNPDESPTIILVPFGVLDEGTGVVEEATTLGNFLGVKRVSDGMDRWHRLAREWAARHRQEKAS